MLVESFMFHFLENERGIRVDLAPFLILSLTILRAGGAGYLVAYLSLIYLTFYRILSLLVSSLPRATNLTFSLLLLNLTL